MRSHAPTYPWYRVMPLWHGQLGCHHTSRGASSRLLAQGSSDVITCHVALAPESPLGVARVLPRGSWLQLPPPSTWQLWSRHVSCDSGSSLLAQDSSRAARCSMELYRPWVIEVNKYPLMILPSWSSIRTCVYLTRRHTTRPILCACETCNGRHIKY
jgi:hypothetical protein